ncbi:MAG: DUF1254 domain-containing protein [Verrucomicrobiales bacterium]|nr:DUF1254 domain-containing protein [Verrucomicrobiales bacterium]
MITLDTPSQARFRPTPWIALLLILVPGGKEAAAGSVTPAEARAIAKEAYIYGFPMVDGYRIQHAYFVDRANPEFKAPWNQLRNMPRVFTSEDKAVQTPNSDTPYSMLGMDLRAEPVVLTVPAIEKERYFSIQLIDAYTHNFDYLGSRSTGNDGGSFLIAGPRWKGKPPSGVKRVVRSETELALAVFRTQLFEPADLEHVKRIQEGYRVEPLSAFLGKPAPRPAPAIDFIAPLTTETQKSSLDFFKVLNFILQFCPRHPSEKELMARFAKINVGAGKKFLPDRMNADLQQALRDGMADAWKEYETLVRTQVAAGKVTSGDVFGTRAYLKNNYLYRMAAAGLGIFGNSKEEAMYPMYRTDATGAALNGSAHRYRLRFAPGQLPPVHAFWSVTMYELPSSLLTPNPIHRYLINSPMIPALKKDADGGITLHLQSESPGKDRESNWLPAPKGPFWCAMRLYWPRSEALTGTWRPPLLESLP